jgi:hypothetical protein
LNKGKELILLSLHAEKASDTFFQLFTAEIDFFGFKEPGVGSLPLCGMSEAE